MGRTVTVVQDVVPETRVPYLNCPRCHLAIRVRHSVLSVRHCPRCVARSRIAIDMFPSRVPMRELIREPVTASGTLSGTNPEP
jgi:hypothetical protein